MDFRYRKTKTERRSLSEKELRRGCRFGCCISLRSFYRTDPGLAFYGKIYNSNLPGFRKFLGMLRKIGRSIKTGLTKRFMSGTVTTSYERGCGQDEEVVQSYCRSGCQGRRRILLRRKLSLYDRHYYGRHYGVHFCCHYFHYWHNSIWLAWGTERLSL